MQVVRVRQAELHWLHGLVAQHRGRRYKVTTTDSALTQPDSHKSLTLLEHPTFSPTSPTQIPRGNPLGRHLMDRLNHSVMHTSSVLGHIVLPWTQSIPRTNPVSLDRILSLGPSPEPGTIRPILRHATSALHALIDL